MNENATKLYEDLKNSRLEAFDMRHWCGTAHCIGGEASIRMGVGNPTEEWEWLGLTEPIGLALLYPDLLQSDDDKEKDKYGQYLASHDADSPWAFLGNASAYKSTQPEAAEALRRACELSALKSTPPAGE